jgi:hypothetical protein
MSVFGVHIWNQDIRHVVKGVATGLIEAGKAAFAQGSIVLILESPAQGFSYKYDYNNITKRHFNNSMSGVFEHLDKSDRTKVEGPCCLVPTNHVKGNFRNIALLEALDNEDPSWHEYMGWVSFYNLTTLYGAHVDSRNDCTHIAWSPFLLDPMWINMDEEIERLSVLQRQHHPME